MVHICQWCTCASNLNGPGFGLDSATAVSALSGTSRIPAISREFGKSIDRLLNQGGGGNDGKKQLFYDGQMKFETPHELLLTKANVCSR